MSSEQLGPVTIGAREIYDAVLRLQGSVDRLSDHQQAQARETDARFAAVGTRIDDHEQRIRTGERSRWPLPSVAVLLSLLALVLTALPMLTGSASHH